MKAATRLTRDETLLLEFARRQLAFDRALVAYNRSPSCEGIEAHNLDAAFRELREFRPRLAAVTLEQPVRDNARRRATA